MTDRDDARAPSGAETTTAGRAPLDDLSAFSSSVFAALAQAIRTSNALPAEEELVFERSIDPHAEDILDEASARALAIANRLIAHATGTTAHGSGPTGQGVVGVTGRGPLHHVEEFADLDHVCDRFAVIVDTVDALLEKADFNLDEASGQNAANRASKALVESTATKAQASKCKGKREVLDYSLIHAANITRPQLQFADEIRNSPNVPWIEKLREKPHAMVPYNPGSFASPPHPYAYEINHYTPPDFLLELRPPLPFHPFEETSAKWIDTEKDLRKLIMELEQENEIAIDLEAHDFRSYLGIVCLMQLSTRDEDYLVDTLKLRSSMQLLNRVFADPNIVKVFHGAQSDIVWLQRDFGLYVVGLFDTYHASHVLEMGQHGLAYLLQHYAGFISDKRFQLADWRIRPLPAEMVRYARSDTHFLLYVYDCMRNELISQSSPESPNLLLEVVRRSAETSLARFEKPGYDAENGRGYGGWRSLLAKYGRLDAVQAAVFKAIHAWRDQVAREEDEGPRYVMPNHMLYAIATRLPKDTAEIYACCTPTPPLVRMYAVEICQIIDQARQAAMVEIQEKTEKANAALAVLGNTGTPVKQQIPFVEHADAEEAGVDFVLDDRGTSVSIPLPRQKVPYVPGSQPRKVPPLNRQPRNVEKVLALRSSLFGPPSKRKRSEQDEEQNSTMKDGRAVEVGRRVLKSMSLASGMPPGASVPKAGQIVR